MTILTRKDWIDFENFVCMKKWWKSKKFSDLKISCHCLLPETRQNKLSLIFIQNQNQGWKTVQYGFFFWTFSALIDALKYMEKLCKNWIHKVLLEKCSHTCDTPYNVCRKRLKGTFFSLGGDWLVDMLIRELLSTRLRKKYFGFSFFPSHSISGLHNICILNDLTKYS